VNSQNNFNIGDLVTSGLRHGLGVVMEISNRSIEHAPVWYYFIKFSDGVSFWVIEEDIKLEGKAKNDG